MLLVLSVALLLRLPTLWEPRWAHDEGALAALAGRCLAGARLYVDAWAAVQPAAVGFEQAVLVVTRGWHPAMQSVLALQFAVATAAVYSITRRLGGRSVAGGLLFGVLTGLPVLGSDHQSATAIASTLVAAGTALAISGRGGRALGAGVLLGSAVATDLAAALPALAAAWFAVASGRPLRVAPLLAGAAVALGIAWLALLPGGSAAAYGSSLGGQRAVLAWANGGVEAAPIALALRLVPVAVILLGGLRIGLESGTAASRLLGAWLPLAAGSALLDPRGDLVQALWVIAPLACLLGLWLPLRLLVPVAAGCLLSAQVLLLLPRAEMTLIARWPLPRPGYGTPFGFTDLPGYYRGWYDRVIGVATEEQYDAGFPGRSTDTARLAASMRVEGSLVVWGDLPWLVAESPRPGAARYLYRDRAVLLQPGSELDTVGAIRLRRPEYVVVDGAPPPALDRALRGTYDRLTFMPGPWRVYGRHSG